MENKLINMKQTELNLQKRLLIIEYKEDELKTALEFANNGSAHKINEQKVKLICKASELTNEILKEIVDAPDNFKFLDIENTFIGEINIAGYYWGENPVSLEREKVYRQIGDEFKADGILRAWQEAESKTFNPEKTLIFEIL